MAKKEPDTSPIRGRYCGRCMGRGDLGFAGHLLRECPDCHWVGFVGVTSEQVREAELMAMGEAK